MNVGERPGPGPVISGASFEEALGRLERIVQELEGKDLTLEETLARYEEGCRLVGECTRRLEDAEQRIRILGSAHADEAPAAGSREGVVPGPGPAPPRAGAREPGRGEAAGENGDIDEESDGLPF